jgi:hypothetical protein
MANPKVRFNTTHYLKDLRALRNNLRNTRKYGANVRGSACFLKIDVYSSSEQSQIQVTMRRSSLYLHAFSNAQTTLYFNDTEKVDGVEKDILVRDSGITYDRLTYSTHYSQLGAFPETGKGLEINGKKLDEAVAQLASIPHNFDSKQWRKDVIGPYFALIVIAVSEATRFGTIAGRVGQSIADPAKAFFSNEIEDKVKNWSASEQSDTDVAIRNV